MLVEKKIEIIETELDINLYEIIRKACPWLPAQFSIVYIEPRGGPGKYLISWKEDEVLPGIYEAKK